MAMSLTTGFALMASVFIAVWLVFVIYSEVSIRKEKEDES
ncbi:hypothetical protein AAC03nite_38300 [Alicyclobacillus acidoterrestris]|nr:hypothetical protein AAC03nite_38300 [Alicyclobacillus acidoterrestris]